MVLKYFFVSANKENFTLKWARCIKEKYHHKWLSANMKQQYEKQHSVIKL